MATFASASSSQVPREKYDVFISFRGSDTRHGFLSHLIKELHQKWINVYVDERLESGDEISSALEEAIERSLISLVIFSKDYPSSTWCLGELEKIMECKKVNDQIVIPVFYNVHPSDVRHQSGTYANAFTKHEEKFKDNMDKLQIRRSTLTKAANISGYHYSSNFQNESELIDAIVKDVLKKLDDKDPIEPKCVVGFDQNFACVESLMEIESQEVRILGIWGPGGIGKTTLARAIFDKYFSKFESCCFMESVREESKKSNGLSNLHQKLLRKLLNQENLNMNDALRARSTMRRLQQKKVLIVLDDVHTSKQLKDLAGEQLYLGLGSKVIVTSRDKHVLLSGGIHDKHIHEVQELNFQESLKLFCLNAFNQSHPKMGYEKLSKMTAAYARGIPLALEVLGSHFHSQNKAYWESELSKLKKYPHKQIQDILKVSYDELDVVDKEIFLDIAFFFVGEQRDDVTRVLDACGFNAVSGIENLVNKALIKINLYGIIEMHDLIREMSEQVVCDECKRHPERRSRLKDAKEISDILKNNMGTDEIEGIILNGDQIKDVQLSANTFTKMKNLRILIFHSLWVKRIELPFGLESFCDKLRYFHWDTYPLESLPLGFCPENLVEFRLEYSNVKKLWEGIQDLPHLKMINLTKCTQLEELPDLSKARNLQIVKLGYCGSLCRIHSSILSLHTLVELDLTCCRKLESLESETHLKSLSRLTLNHCKSLKKFCLSLEIPRLNLWGCKIEILHFPSGRFTKLRELFLNGSRLRSLPISELCRLTYLEIFHLNYFSQVIDIKNLQVLIGAWRCLRELSLKGCRKMSKIPNNIKALTKLELLELDETSIEILPACIQHLSNLAGIYLRKCKMLRSILGLPRVLKVLDASECTSLETVFSSSRKQEFPFQQKYLDRGRCFELKNCPKLEEHSLRFIEDLTHLSVISAPENDYFYTVKACYSGSRVPNWIRHKQTAVASNIIEFTCDLERSLGMVFCCVLPSTSMEITVCCNYLDDNHKFYTEYGHDSDSYPLEDFNSDHVFLWYEKFEPDDARTSYHGNIACEFSVRYWKDSKIVDSDVLTRACGVCLINASELKLKLKLDSKRKRDADVDVEEQFPPTKKLENSTFGSSHSGFPLAFSRCEISTVRFI